MALLYRQWLPVRISLRLIETELFAEQISAGCQGLQFGGSDIAWQRH
jgi:hypothetical protein